MEPSVSRLEDALAATEIRRPRIPVVSNADAQPHADPAIIKKISARQGSYKQFAFPVTSPVQGETTVTTLLAKGLKKSYELGPGKALSREWTRKQKQRILAPEMAAGGVPQVVPDQRIIIAGALGAQGLLPVVSSLLRDIAAQRSLPCLPKCRKTLPCAGKFFPYSSVSGMVSWYLLMGAAKPGEFGSENFRWCLH
ncbi:hypothetical protein OIU84_025329 [Salix udensis]|uniref:Uncharacterized protein n=1 Tax=Salix udensis TaxID=889485 RepID=A0AAD6PDH7_9ROSI|nr:hypothetical protein OIU84_025329 [Salix udensis]